jgi:hypothetical protein
LELAGELWAIEIKLTSSPSQEMMLELDQAAELIGATRRFLVSQTRQSIGDERRCSCDLATLVGHLLTA